ncbi:hypothetical protein R6258_15745 [Halomonas sp. HP20-15]|uniref:hypothetical protein n=1 Tax=Halomonas sp. HP20-15 TaxID=3085901 RepID=UPI0029825A42|nr:hypothetical protein [Halomonas sp. HP20-15]MDW5378378.1 hypothetical protein [Halomonas sp. HP20-15]
MIDLDTVLHAREALAGTPPQQGTPGDLALRAIAGEIGAKRRANPELDDPGAIHLLVTESQGRVGLDEELCRKACDYAQSGR